MFRMEFHASEGGADAEAFASELAHGVARHAGLTVTRAGRVICATTEHRL
ncbi:hypothetical protein [Aeromicrobium sp. 179-A 4D2 NHS]